MKHARHTARAGFTLIELLTVLAIVALLTAILIPAVGKFMASARRAEVASNLRQIALGYAASMGDAAQPRILRADTLDDMALLLAREAGINDARLYVSTDDPLVQAATAPLADAVAFVDNGNWTLNPAFAAQPLSVVIVSGIPPTAPASSTPVLWTRGLGSDGRWAPASATNPGVYGNAGGFVAFLDGHVEWHRDLRGDDENGVLRNFATQRPTANILEALPPGATVLE